MAVLLILEPIFEADFLDCSYGFRPRRSAHQALEAIRVNLQAGRRVVYDAQLRGWSNYFSLAGVILVKRSAGTNIYTALDWCICELSAMLCCLVHAGGEGYRESRMREIPTSGLTRGDRRSDNSSCPLLYRLCVNNPGYRDARAGGHPVDCHSRYALSLNSRLRGND